MIHIVFILYTEERNVANSDLMSVYTKFQTVCSRHS